jgi:sortase A
MKGKFRRRVLSPLLLVLGTGLLVYVAHAYWGMYQEQKDLSNEWELQAAALEHHAAAAARSALPAPRKTRKIASQISSQAMLTRVVIPSIDLDAIMVEGVSKRQLAKGPGHMKETAAPGERGNAVITGHRDTFFRHIHELNPGDDILIRRQGRVFRYQVTGKKIVWPQDVGVLDPTPDAELTLITCYPTYYIGPAPKRLVVFSRLVGTEADTPDQPAAAGASH